MSSHVYRRTSSVGAPILTVDNNGWVYEGTPMFGVPIMKITGEGL
jgi:hypothetical protein